MLQEAGIGYNPELIARWETDKILAHERLHARDTMRDRGVPQWVRETIFRVANKHCVYVSEVLGESRRKQVVGARHEAMYLIKATKPGLSFPQIAKWFARDHTTTIYAVAHYGLRNGLPAFTSSKGRR